MPWNALQSGYFNVADCERLYMIATLRQRRRDTGWLCDLPAPDQRPTENRLFFCGSAAVAGCGINLGDSPIGLKGPERLWAGQKKFFIKFFSGVPGDSCLVRIFSG